jgi:hypothetical protein
LCQKQYQEKENDPSIILDGALSNRPVQGKDESQEYMPDSGQDVDIISVFDQVPFFGNDYQAGCDKSDGQTEKQEKDRESIQGRTHFLFVRPECDEDGESRHLEEAPVCKERLQKTLSIINLRRDEGKHDAEEKPPEWDQPMHGLAYQSPPVESEHEEQRQQVECERAVDSDQPGNGDNVEKVHGADKEQENPHLDVTPSFSGNSPDGPAHLIRKINWNRTDSTWTEKAPYPRYFR